MSNINDISKVVLFTDGGCSINPGKGGNCVYMITLDRNNKLINRVVYSRFKEKTTNNEMELNAFLLAISACRKISETNKDCTFEIISDSEYCLNGIRNNWLLGWHKKNYLKDGIPRPNWLVWKEIYRLMYTESMVSKIKLSWVRGHGENNTGNYICDKYAVQAYLDGKGVLLNYKDNDYSVLHYLEKGF